MSARARPYADPYLTGVVLGLVLLAAFAVSGRGLGASGAFASVATAALDGIGLVPADDGFFTAHAGPLLRDWLVVEMIGVLVGGFASAALAGRLRVAVERGPRAGVRTRLALAGAGGAVMGAGAVLARGCTSGQALTGGSLLAVGSWTFIASAFAAAYLVAWPLRRQWT